MSIDPQILAERKKMQLEILLKESDLKKLERFKMQAETDIRDIKHKTDLLNAEMISKESQLKKIESEHMMLYNEIVKMKHKMNSLGHSIMS